MLYNTVLCLGDTYKVFNAEIQWQLLCQMQDIKMQEIMEMQSTSAMVTHRNEVLVQWQIRFCCELTC